MYKRIKLNNPNEEFCLGLYVHTATKITIDEDTDEQEISDEKAYRIIFGFLIFSIELIW